MFKSTFNSVIAVLVAAIRSLFGRIMYRLDRFNTHGWWIVRDRLTYGALMAAGPTFMLFAWIACYQLWSEETGWLVQTLLLTILGYAVSTLLVSFTININAYDWNSFQVRVLNKTAAYVVAAFVAYAVLRGFFGWIMEPCSWDVWLYVPLVLAPFHIMNQLIDAAPRYSTT